MNGFFQHLRFYMGCLMCCRTWGVALGNIALIIASIAPIAAVAIVLKYCSKKSSRVILGLKWGERTASEENVVVKYTARQYAYFAWLQTNLLALQDLKIRLLLNYTGIAHSSLISAFGIEIIFLERNAPA